MKTLQQNIKIGKTKGKDTIADATNVFNNWIDPDFRNYGTNKESGDTKKEEFKVFEMDKDGTFKNIFINPDEMKMTQGQIIEFCKEHQGLLGQEGWSTFFLFKTGDEFFVAAVVVLSDGLRVYVHRFSREFVWYGVYRHRMVVPQLATLESSESLSDFNDLSLEKAIEVCKQAGLTITRTY